MRPLYQSVHLRCGYGLELNFTAHSVKIQTPNHKEVWAFLMLATVDNQQS